MKTIYAHSPNSLNEWHRLVDHIQGVEKLVCKFSKGFWWQQEAILAARYHDMGKVGDRFQRRLVDQESRLDHWSIGAWYALSEGKSPAAALAIQGHHIGLQSGSRDFPKTLNPENLLRQHPLKLRLTSDNPEYIKTFFVDNIAKPLTISNRIDWFSKNDNYLGGMVDVRMLFSTLVDADFLDTEAHFQADTNKKRHRLNSQKLEPKKALSRLQDFIEQLSNSRKCYSNSDVLNVRNTLRKTLAERANVDIGVYTLTAPTGAGKTLAMLEFSLLHGQHHNLERIIVVIPYLNILDQTAQLFRQIFEQVFGEGYILEDHSLAKSTFVMRDSEDKSEQAERLLAENWDAPLILTTNVQILESLFSNRPSKCRKLHRLAQSVILFDEAQTLPPALAPSTLATLSKLSAHYRTTIIFSTATQPAFEHLQESVASLYAKGWQPKELVLNHSQLFSKLRRVEVKWPQKSISLNTLATMLLNQTQALCILNLKRDVLSLASILQQTGRKIFYLSTSMCPLHRQEILKKVRTHLAENSPILLVATQCVEAGVDLDFPVVYRALGPLEAIVQAAGRCNREGRLASGKLVVFELEAKEGYKERYNYPSHDYYQATLLTKAMLKEREFSLDIYDPSIFSCYYKRFFELNSPEVSKRATEIHSAIIAMDFARLAEVYRVIDQETVNVVVPYRQDLFDELVSIEQTRGIDTTWKRKAQRISVSIFKPKHDDTLWSILYPAKTVYGSESHEWYVLKNGNYYNENYGFFVPERYEVLIG